ncbi:amino acid ABC transporter permease [Longibacter salinarum]|uniref:Amino acid ABC transporter permease n=1 Tax=Longibacter salinarum TaxID=1850348 RepID=A0A2A8CY66_9BACT|nr:glycine betaine ABC transporter substrate-binding protein [Longibacter salinarum]PEN13544.1 amino acid ABC transporter permease [Longibacter salinarum]
MLRLFALVIFCIALLSPRPTVAQKATEAEAADSTLVVGSKKFTENVILGWMATELWRAQGYTVQHRAELGGSRFLWEALRRGDIDAYPEYTGTLIQEILASTDVTRATLADTLAQYGIAMTDPLGFNNTYAIGMRADHADSLGIRTIGDLRNHPNLELGFSNEFMERGDGWPSLRRTYDLPHDARGIDHDLAYRGLRSGEIDVIDFYSTDAEIEAYDLRVLQDTRDHFPEYRALFLYRSNVSDRVPGAVQQLRRLTGRLPADTMQTLNKRAKIDGQAEQNVAAQFLNSSFDLDQTVKASTTTWVHRIAVRSTEHLTLVGLSLILAVLFGIPLGIMAARVRIVGPTVLLVVGVLYTIPALALLAVMVPIIGLGRTPAITALFLYSLLPIVWNTYTGLNDIPRGLKESAEALGLSRTAQLLRVEVPMAARSILGGIKIAAVINIGTATLGALIGAGGYGQPILTGIRRADLSLILEGTVPAAILTVFVLGALEATERGLLPRGLR